MFSPARIVVLDDKPEHLAAIQDAFQELGAPCLGLKYDPEVPPKRRCFAGVRALFLDFHLLTAVPSTDNRQHFAVIANILEENISPTGGPYVLVLWTQYDEEAKGLAEYLADPAVGLPLHARPLMVLSLSKGDFIHLDDGTARDSGALRTEVKNAIRQNAQLRALLAWESEVQSAAGNALSALVQLVSKEKRSPEAFSCGLQEILTRLAVAAVGKQHVDNDPRTAVLSVLAPILADSIMNMKPTEDSRIAWEQAVSNTRFGPWEPNRSGTVNRMLHVAVPASETISATAWGSVVQFSEEWSDKGKLRSLFGVSQKEILGNEFKLGRADRARCRARLVRVGAACDYAQNRSGPLQYFLGMEIPCDIDRENREGVVRLPAAEWRSPALALDATARPVFLAVNARYSLSVTRDRAQGWKPLYRLREQLLMHLISHLSRHLARPGIIAL